LKLLDDSMALNTEDFNSTGQVNTRNMLTLEHSVHMTQITDQNAIQFKSIEEERLEKQQDPPNKKSNAAPLVQVET
jgi:hypothetical protein